MKNRKAYLAIGFSPPKEGKRYSGARIDEINADGIVTKVTPVYTAPVDEFHIVLDENEFIHYVMLTEDAIYLLRVVPKE